MAVSMPVVLLCATMRAPASAAPVGSMAEPSIEALLTVCCAWSRQQQATLATNASSAAQIRVDRMGSPETGVQPASVCQRRLRGSGEETGGRAALGMQQLAGRQATGVARKSRREAGAKRDGSRGGLAYEVMR